MCHSATHWCFTHLLLKKIPHNKICSPTYLYVFCFFLNFFLGGGDWFDLIFYKFELLELISLSVVYRSAISFCNLINSTCPVSQLLHCNVMDLSYCHLLFKKKITDHQKENQQQVTRHTTNTSRLPVMDLLVPWRDTHSAAVVMY